MSLKFEQIAIRALESNSNGTISTGSHRNNHTGNGSRNVGRDGQINGAPYPACPYHMPINNSRFNDPRLFLPNKNVGDIIRADDLNDLINRIKLMLYSWNAEQNDVRGYGIHSKIRPTLINLQPNNIVRSEPSKFAGTEAQPSISIMDATGGYVDVVEPVKYGFYMCRGSDKTDVINKLNNAKNNRNATPYNSFKDHLIGDVLPFDFPVNIKNRFSSDCHAGISDLTIIRADNYTSTELQDGYALYLPETNEYVTDSNGLKVIFHFETPCLWSHRTPEPEGLQRFTGIISLRIDKPLWSKQAQTDAIGEGDITYQLHHVKNIKGKYPKITPIVWNNIRATLKNYCNAVVNLNNLTTDPDNTEILNFLSAQAGTGATEVDLNNPDTAFENFQAKKGAIIKVGFYNTLVAAYKVIVNSCLCNADCSCNSNCLCNTNCGCNY